jgi:hypothetical protein
MTEEIKNRIHNLAVKQIISDFKFIKERSLGESIYGFGLGLVGDITGFFSAANTIESLKKTLSKEDDNEDISSFWYISEWEYEGTKDNTLYEFLATFIYDLKEDEYDSVMKNYEEILIKALQTCDEKGIFGIGKDRDDIIVYLHYADATDEDIDDISSEQINQPYFHNLFKERWNTEKNNLTKVIEKRMAR